jgi:phage terminase large subunit-like protein
MTAEAPERVGRYIRPFSLGDYLDGFDARLFAVPEGRVELCRLDPLLFALVYLPHHLKSSATDDRITLSEFHLDLAEQALAWVRPLNRQREYRDVYVAPRDTGKSTWLFLILPLWAAAYGHVQFIAAFADATTQAEQHLMNFKHELDANELLRADFPDLCRPLTGNTVRRQLANSRGQIQQSNGFTFMARGIDSAVAGLKVGHTRPQVIILDDVEPDESNYSAHQMTKRLRTIVDNILPLNTFARVLLVGTVTMPGSIIHQAVRSVLNPTAPADWIADERFRVHYYNAIQVNDDGTERSLWPDKWPLAELQAQRHTRSFRKNMANDPLGADGDYWTVDDFRYTTVPGVTRTILSVDPAVTTRTSSDWTGLAVVGYSPSERRCQVEYAAEVRLTGTALRAAVVRVLEAHPHIGTVLIETNQGGDLWSDVFAGLPVPLKHVRQSESKEVRAAGVLNWYQQGRVTHTRSLPAAEEQMVVFPGGLHDDVVDAVVSGVRYFLLSRPAPRRPAVTTVSYARR